MEQRERIPSEAGDNGCPEIIFFDQPPGMLYYGSLKIEPVAFLRLGRVRGLELNVNGVNL